MNTFVNEEILLLDVYFKMSPILRKYIIKSNANIGGDIFLLWFL